MTSRTRTAVFSFLAVTLAIIVVPAFAQIPDGVSPGAADRAAKIEGRCPTFIWSPVPGAAFHELVGYRLSKDSESADLSAIDLSDAEQVLYAKVPGIASAWEPELAECLTPGGKYVWFVRAVYREEESEVVEASEWSYGRYFSISSMPSAQEVEEALTVLRRYTGHQVGPEGLKTERADTTRAAPSRRVEVPQQVQKSVTSAKAAIKGIVPDTTGETYGVVGTSNSPNGAGVAAANTNGGADLVIDGSEDGQPDAVITQAGIDRASPSEQWFSLINSDTGVLSLNVEGTIVGDGSGLTAVDADTLDGTEGSDFATEVEAAAIVTAHAASNEHNWLYFTQKELGTSGGSTVHWGNLTAVPSGLDDGDDNTTYSAGVGLELAGTQFSAIGYSFAPFDNTITTIDDGGSVDAWSSITIGVDGLPIVSYYEGTARSINVAHCSNLECTSADIAVVDGSGFSASDTSITIGADRLPLVAYYDQANRYLMVAHCSDLACTSATLTTVDTVLAPGSGISITIGADGLPIISYLANGSLKVAHCSDSGCTSAALTTIDSTGMAGINSSIMVGADALPLISYYDLDNNGLKVAHCLVQTCTSATIATIDSVGDVGYDSSITLGTDGLAVISYYDYPNGLKVAHCSDLACTSATTTTVDNAGDIRFNSITIGADGLPVISYHDLVKGALKVAHCSDVACTSVTFTAVDGVGAGWISTSITIGADGLPVISYYDKTAEKLKVAHCANEFCIPYARRR
jgi:hypothetical protein